MQTDNSINFSTQSADENRQLLCSADYYYFPSFYSFAPCSTENNHFWRGLMSRLETTITVINFSGSKMPQRLELTARIVGGISFTVDWLMVDVFLAFSTISLPFSPGSSVCFRCVECDDAKNNKFLPFEPDFGTKYQFFSIICAITANGAMWPGSISSYLPVGMNKTLLQNTNERASHAQCLPYGKFRLRKY